MQASYRRWHTRCVPQCARACEQVARSWADAALRDIATNGRLSAVTTTIANSKRAITSPHKWRRGPNLIFENRPPRNSKGGLETALLARATRNHSWRANVALGVRLDSDLAVLGSSFVRNVTLSRFQTRGCCAKRACCITLQYHDQPESW